MLVASLLQTLLSLEVCTCVCVCVCVLGEFSRLTLLSTGLKDGLYPISKSKYALRLQVGNWSRVSHMQCRVLLTATKQAAQRGVTTLGRSM